MILALWLAAHAAMIAWALLVAWCAPAFARLLTSHPKTRVYDPLRAVVLLSVVPCLAFSIRRLIFGMHAEVLPDGEIAMLISTYLFATACSLLTFLVVRGYEHAG